MKSRTTIVATMVLAAGVRAAVNAASSVPEPHGVPELLTAFDGRAVTNRTAWESVRRPELLDRFLACMYGRRPTGADTPDLAFEAEDADVLMMGGKAIRKRIRIRYKGPFGENSFCVLAFVPVSEKPTPAFVLICNRNPEKNIDPSRELKSDFWPAERIVERGYAAVTFFNGDVAPETYNPATAFLGGVFPCFECPWDRTDESWGTLSAWAWGASRVIDWIEREPLIDSRRVAVVGHSRGGKACLLAGVTDSRFAMTCVNCSGCGGAKLAHIDLPGSEHYAAFLASRVTYWFCGAFQRYCMNHDIRAVARDGEMDFDQHELLALIAPRLLAVGSASDDVWAGPVGEFHATRLASPVWELYGSSGIGAAAFPSRNSSIQSGSVCYHLREGKHDLTVYDWNAYMDFADSHGWRGQP